MDLQCTVHKHVNSNYIYFNSLAPAHDEATMALEGHSRQTLGEVVCWLMLTCNLTIFYLRLVSRSEFLDWIDTSVDMLGARIHTTPLDKEDTCIVKLRYESRRRLLVS